MKNYQKGSAILWVIILAVIVAALIGYIFVSRSNQSHVTLSDSGLANLDTAQPNNIQQEATSTSPITTTTSSSSNMTCDKLIPLSVVVGVIPPTVKLIGPHTQTFTDGLICSYRSSDNSYIVGESYNPDRTFDQAVAASEDAIRVSFDPKCVSSTIGSKSTECTYGTIAGGITISNATALIFKTSNSKYDISVNMNAFGHFNSTQATEQIAN